MAGLQQTPVHRYRGKKKQKNKEAQLANSFQLRFVLPVNYEVTLCCLAPLRLTELRHSMDNKLWEKMKAFVSAAGNYKRYREAQSKCKGLACIP